MKGRKTDLIEEAKQLGCPVSKYWTLDKLKHELHQWKLHEDYWGKIAGEEKLPRPSKRNAGPPFYKKK